MPSESVVFQQMMEGMFVRGIGHDLSPEGKKKLREVGLDLDKKLLPAYAVSVWQEALKIAAADVHPRMPEADSLRYLGERFIDGFVETIVGKALGQLVRILGIQRAMNRFTQSLRSGSNFIESKVEHLTPNSFTTALSSVHGQPTFWQGLLYAGAKYMGLKEPIVTIESTEGQSCTYLIKWV